MFGEHLKLLGKPQFMENLSKQTVEEHRERKQNTQKTFNSTLSDKKTTQKG